ncbi:hypothetical protein HYV49_01990 [Candidatus Pacearchaeota archaeon]|nr:hypothetical protein [Candidatus Pacearchaeota archaeon]
MKKSNLKEKTIGISSGLSGVLSFLGGYQVCHNVCLGIIALLSVIGITIVGMPLLFLQKVAVPFWIAALLLLATALVFYFRSRCISKNMIILNAGIIIAGTPFFQDYSIFFWIIGGSIVFLSMLFLLKDKLKNKQIFK